MDSEANLQSKENNLPKKPEFYLLVKNLKVSYCAPSNGWNILFCNCNKPRKTVVDDVTFLAQPGRVLAIVGSTDSGRTTTLNAIANRLEKNNLKGIITGIPATKENNIGKKESVLLRTHTPYFETPAFSLANSADDHLPGNLTVEESLEYAIQLKLPGLPKHASKTHVTSMLYRMRLSECKNVKVGDAFSKGISTGERRRLVIAMELLDTRKSIILLDKPTNGVDNAQARQLLQLLQNIAREDRKTVVISLDQPPSGAFDYIDDLVVLHNGQIIYAGPSSETTSYLQKNLGITVPQGVCLTDILVEIAGSSHSSRFAHDYAKSYYNTADDVSNQKCLTVSNDKIRNHLESNLFPLPNTQTVRNTNIVLPKDWHNVFTESPAGIQHAAYISRIEENQGRQLTCRLSTSRKTFIHNVFFFFSTVALLCKRSFVNKLRSYTFWVPAILALFQGLLLGGIMWRYDALLPNSEITPFISSNTWTESLFGDILAHGFGIHNGTNIPQQPLFDVLEHGIDGNGSYIFHDTFQNQTDFIVKTARSFIRRAYDFFNLTNYGYPPVTYLPESAKHDNKTEQLDYSEILPNIVMTAQVADFMWNRIMWEDLANCYKQKASFLSPEFCLLEKGGWMVNFVLYVLNVTGSSVGDAQPNVIPEMNITNFHNQPNSISYHFDETNNPFKEWFSKLQNQLNALPQWKRPQQIINGLLQGSSLDHLLLLLFSPKTQGNPNVLDNNLQLAVLLRTVQNIVDWSSSPSLTNDPNALGFFDSLHNLTATFNTNEYINKNVSFSNFSNKMKSNSTVIICTSQFCKLLKKSYQCVQDKITLFIEKTLPHIISSAWTGLISTGCLFATVATIGFFCFDALLSFHKDRILLNRESANGTYTASSFFLAKNIVDLPAQITIALLTASTWGVMAGVIVSVKQYFVYFGIAALICFATYGFCYFVSAITPRMEVAIVVAPLMLISWLIFTGFTLRSDELIPKCVLWYRYISLHRYGWFALMHNTFDAFKTYGNLPSDFVVWLMGVETSLSISEMAAVLISLGICFRILGLLCLSNFYSKVGLAR